MFRLWLLLMVLFVASCNPAKKTSEFSTQVNYLGESYPVNCDVYSSYHAWGKDYTSSTHCSVRVDGTSSPCAVNYDLFESDDVARYPVEANAVLVSVCGPTIERMKNADDDNDDSGYSPPT